ncbi:EAL domain-containing protein [Pseudoduganella sp.]|uniref:bifunctional diguanylate cyclase/phosphodiesterase n=1 Tax=Pseudoduganella sp. TaxID=1880898 RepID=UPI0035AEB3DC
MSTTDAYRRFRRRLLVTMAMLALLATAVVAWQLLSSARDREQAIRQQTQHYARAIEAQVLSTIQLSDIALLGFANAIKVAPYTPQTVDALLSSRGATFGSSFWITFIDPNGFATASSRDIPVKGINYQDRDYFQAQLKPGNSLYVGEPTYGRISKSRLFFLSRRVDNAKGQFLGVIVAPINASTLAQTFENSRLSDDVTVTLFHTNGRIIARAPLFEQTFNRDISDSNVYRSFRNSPIDTLTTISPIDHKSRIASYRKLPNLPLVVLVGSSNVGLALISQRHFIIAGLALFLIFLLIAAATIYALHSFAAAEERERRIHDLYVTSNETEKKLAKSEQRLRLIADNLPIVIAYVGKDEKYTFKNRRFAEIYGEGDSLQQVLPPEIYAETRPHLERAFNGEMVHFERHIQRNDQDCCDAITYVPDRDENGNVIGLFVMAEDISERKRHEEASKLATLMYDNASEGMMVTDAEGRILSVNPAFSRISGYPADEVIGHLAYELTSGQQDIKFFSRMRQTITHTGYWEGEVWHQHKNGDHYLVSLRFNTVFDDQGNALRHVALFSDITKKKATEEAIWKEANFDALTGLPNRRMFNERLRQEMKKSARDIAPMALVFIDLDGFKAVNDTLGHDFGDILLKQVAERLLQCVRNTDTVARLGGDEFTVILSELKDTGDVVRIVQDILHSLARPFQLKHETAEISGSIGIALFPDDASDAETLIKCADQAMYLAKQQGRNRFSYFAPFMQEASQLRIELCKELRNALKNKELQLLFQPIRNLANGKVQMAEALIRWEHPQRGLLKPAEFIGVAENTGIIESIGEWVFQEAATQAASFGDGFQVCVNKSAWQFRHEAVGVDHWLALLREQALPARSIIIEVTESLLLEASREVVERIQSLRDANMQISLDDFGHGYSSLNFLKRFKIDYLKLDTSFTENQALCEAIVAMAHKLGIKVIAEKIETEEQLKILMAAGCDFGQGFLFGEPISAQNLHRLLIT